MALPDILLAVGITATLLGAQALADFLAMLV